MIRIARRISRFSGILLVLLLVATSIRSMPALAQSNATTVYGISVYPTIECVGVVATYTGDDNTNNSATLEWKKTSDSGWKSGLPMAKLYGQSAQAGSVIGLAGNTLYDIRVRFSDPDGVSGTNPITATVTTRPDTYRLGNGRTYYVSASTGNDSAVGSQAHPWKTVQHAADTVSAGDTVRMEPGTYYEQVSITHKSGLDYGSMISFIGDDPANKPVISGANQAIETNAGGTIWTSAGNGTYYTSYSTGLPNYVAANDTRLFQYHDATEWGKRGTGDYAGLRGGYYWNSGTNRLYIELLDDSNPNNSTLYSPIHVGDHSNSASDSGFRILGSDYVRIRGIDIRYFQYGVAFNPDGTAGSAHGIVESCYINHTAQGVYEYNPGAYAVSVDLLVQDNTFYDNGPSNWPWDALKSIPYEYGEGNAIGFWYNGQGAVIRNNTSNGYFDGEASGDWSDGWSYGDRNNIRDIDVYKNTFYNCGDDGITLAGTDINVRIWGNTLHDSHTVVSTAPVALGPAYVFKNVGYNINAAGSGAISRYAFKLGHALAQGKEYYFNNTIYDPIDTYTCGWFDQDAPESPGFDITSENNVFVGTYWAIYLTICSSGCSFDYDNIYTSKSGDKFGWNGTRYNTWAAFKSGTGQESHGSNNNGAACDFVDAANGNFNLQAGGPLIDAGVVIPGFNDVGDPYQYSGSAPDIGAFEFTSSGSIPLLNAELSTSPTEGIVGVTQFAFTDASSGGTPPYTYQWDFDNNGTWDSTAQNPTYAYSAPGNYTVTLKVTDAAANTNTKSKTGYIAVYNRGDANQDGNINSLDVTKVKRIIVGLDSPTPGADANGDGNVNALDITQIELIIAGY